MISNNTAEKKFAAKYLWVLLAVIGLFIVLSAIWIGSYFAFELPSMHWAKFPTIFTSILAFFGGLLIVGFSCLYLRCNNER
jgi:uncharacterized integral membrane protein